LADKCKALFFETSSKTNTNVTESFSELVKSLRKVGFSESCQCKGKCTCKEKCAKCGKQKGAHKKSDHEFKKKGGGMCTLL